MAPLQQWTVFSLGGGITDTTTTDDLSGSTYIKGNVGVGGSGDINLTGNATIDGNLVYRSNGTLKMSGNSRVTGTTVHGGDSDLDISSSAAILTSNNAFAMPVTPIYAGITNIQGSQNVTLTGVPGQTVVLKLQNFTLTTGSLTLQGGANFVINVSNQFSLTNHSQIILALGTTWDDVLFNVRGGGSKVDLSGQSTLQGVLMANDRTVSVSGGAMVTGKVIANKVSLSGGSQIVSQ